MDREALSTYLEIADLAPRSGMDASDPNAWRVEEAKVEAVRKAIASLTDLARGDLIELQGKLFSDVITDARNLFTETIPSPRLTDFGRFDLLDDSLLRGEGVAWGNDFREIEQPDDDRHYRWVGVRRKDLMQCFPAPKAPSVTSTAAAEVECQAWLLDQFEGDLDRRKAKSEFLAGAIEEFGTRLSRRGFERAWRVVAPSQDRDKGGAKRKHKS